MTNISKEMLSSGNNKYQKLFECKCLVWRKKESEEDLAQWKKGDLYFVLGSGAALHSEIDT